MSTVIGVCGYPGAGKSTFCREMASRFGLPVIATGEVVRRRIAERGWTPTPASVAQMSDEIRAATGQRFLRVVQPEMVAALGRAPAVLLDCVREEADLLTLREVANRVALVAIAAAGPVRAARSLGRARPGDPTSAEDLAAREQMERRLGVADLLARAEHTLVNDHGLADFLDRAAATVRGILGAA